MQKKQFLSVFGSPILLSACLALSVLAGCDNGPERFAVNGKVLFREDATPATFGDIEFRSVEEPVVLARGKIQRDGSFKVGSKGVDGTVTGWHTVVILQPIDPAAARHQHNHGHDAHNKYGDHRTTDLKVEVVADKEGNRDLQLEIDALVK